MLGQGPAYNNLPCPTWPWLVCRAFFNWKRANLPMRSRSALVAASASPVELVSESFLVVSILVGGGIS